MSLTDNREISEVMKWASQDETYGFNQGFSEKTSYYDAFDNEWNIDSYNIETVEDFLEKFNRYWSTDADKKISIICAVSAFKGMPDNDVIEKSKQNGLIPDFVYTF